MTGGLLQATVSGLAAAVLAGGAAAVEWPAHQCDAERSGVSAEPLDFPLVGSWVYKPHLPPAPAWPEPGKELHRMDFDYAFQPVAAGGLVYFGSSADDALRALDAQTGQLVWRFVAEGPIRLAPAIGRGNAYFASDDGVVYCLKADTGKLAWRFQAAPNPDRILGNGRLIARHPCRSGVLLVENTLYVTAGMWPTEGVYLYALNADTGQEVWCNDSSGVLYLDLPHAGASGFSGVAPQGYLLASGHYLLVPTGRSVPAVFDRRTGRLLYHKPEKTHYQGAQYGGGVWCTAAGDLFFNTNNRFQNPSQAYVGEAEPSPQDGMIAYSFASGDQHCHIPGKYRVLVAGDTVYAAGQGAIDALELNAVQNRSRISPKDARWTADHPSRVYCLALAGRILLTGNRDSIAAYDTASGRLVWQAALPGQQVRGIAVAGGRLLAATHTGSILCYGSGGRELKVVEEKPLTPADDPEQQTAARDIVRRTGCLEGYALVVGQRDSRFAEALAGQTRLHIVNVIQGAAQASAERARLLEAGLLGSRIAVHAVEDLSQFHLPPYFANVVVVAARANAVSPEQCYRAVRPCGGTLCFVGFDEARINAFVRSANVPRQELNANRGFIVRGPLPGGGEWRHPWADGGRSGVGSDSRVRLPLELLWFGGPGPNRLVDRHLMGSPPVSASGRVFMQGEHHVIAFDAYNGRELWRQEVQDVGRKYSQYYSSSIVADDDSVYVVQRDRCHRLDQTTGRTVSTHRIPDAVVKGVSPAETDYLDIQWPKVWRVIGPLPGGAAARPPLKPDNLKAIPTQAMLKGAEHRAASLSAVNGVIDFTRLYGGYGFQPARPGETPGTAPRQSSKPNDREAGRVCYAFAKIHCPKDGKLLIGAGADWWMQWHLDGKPVFDTLAEGNQGSGDRYFSKSPCSTQDFLFEVEVAAGEHVLAVMVKSGSRGWALSSASMARRAKELMPVAAGEDPNVPNLRDLAWGYLSVADDLLLGGYNVPIAEGQPADSHLIWRSESKAVFALNKNDGSLRWVYWPQKDRIVANIEIAFGDGRLFLIDGTSKVDCLKASRRGGKIDAKLTLVALNLPDGKELWRQSDVPLLGDRSAPTRLRSNLTHLFMGLPNWGHLAYANGVVVLGANAAYDAATGEKLWAKDIRPQKLPIVLGDWLIAQPHAYHLRTGQQRMLEDPLTGQQTPWVYGRAFGCGPVNGCQHLLFFRSGADGIVNPEVGGTTNFGGVRPNCTRSMLAAGGLLIHPEGYSGCCCSYNYQTSLALAPSSERGDTWCAFPQHAATGPIRRVAINFGAPGDQKDVHNTEWLGFPRPMLAEARRSPIAVVMDNSTCYHQRRSAAAMRGAESPWLYSSGLRGQGTIHIGLERQPDLVLPTLDASPTIDGDLDDSCWRLAKLVPFENSPFTMLAAHVDLRVFKDGSRLYFGYHRRPIAGAAENADANTLANSDGLEIFLADVRSQGGILFRLPRNGQAAATFGAVDRYRKTDPLWKGDWRSALRQIPGGWTAEVAIPLRTLSDSGIDVGRLQLNCMSRNLTASGLETIFLTDPSYSANFDRCLGFLKVAAAPAEPPKQRWFTVRLHFAEIDEVQVGQRVFDVAIQGNPVLKDLDVVNEAGGRNIPLVKEFRGIAASEEIALELTAKTSNRDTKSQPAICAVEVVEEL